MKFSSTQEMIDYVKEYGDTYFNDAYMKSFKCKVLDKVYYSKYVIIYELKYRGGSERCYKVIYFDEGVKTSRSPYPDNIQAAFISLKDAENYIKELLIKDIIE